MENQNLRGIVLMLVSMALFAVEDMFLKWAAADVPIGQIIFVSGAFGLPIFAYMARREGSRIITSDEWHPAVLARAGGEMVGSFAYLLALASLPLSTVSAVLQAMPLAITLAATLFMQEKVGWRRWIAIGVGFSGVLLVVRPGMAGFRPEAVWMLVCVAGLTLRDLATRRIPSRCTTAQVSAWGLFSVSILGAAIMAYSGEVKVPSLWECGILLGAVAFGTGGYWAITAAARTGEVSVVAPFRYVRLIFAIVIGAVVFAELPDQMTLMGAALIIGSGLYSFTRERRRRATDTNSSFP